MKSLIIGGTGFVGRHLANKLPDAIIAGRSIEKIQKVFGREREARVWDPYRPPESSFLHGVDAVFNLAGESVFQGRWNAAKKDRIQTSRVHGTKRLLETIALAEKKPKILINSSAIGFYGSRGEEELTEQSVPGNDFLAKVCIEAEKTALSGEEHGLRVVLIRTGIVLGTKGGALSKMLLPFKYGLGGRLGSGRQYMSWIHIDDLVGIMVHALENTQLRGPVNAVAPKAVSNSEFTRALAKALHRPGLLPVPAIILKVVLGEFATVLLGSQRVVPEALEQAGFRFSYPELDAALANLLG